MERCLLHVQHLYDLFWLLELAHLFRTLKLRPVHPVDREDGPFKAVPEGQTRRGQRPFTRTNVLNAHSPNGKVWCLRNSKCQVAVPDKGDIGDPLQVDWNGVEFDKEAGEEEHRYCYNWAHEGCHLRGKRES